MPLFNYYVDIARVFSNDYKKHYQGQLPNELYLQSQYLLDHPKITKIIFGSSRIGNGFDLQKYNAWYKAWHQGANLVEHEKTLKHLLNNKKHIEEIVIAIDHLSFFSKAKDNDYFRQNAPEGLKDTLEFYKFYLYRIPSLKDLKAFLENNLVNNRKHIFSNIGNNNNNEPTYFDNQNMFQSKRKISEINYTKNLIALENMILLSKKHNIKFSFFLQPYHYKNLLGQDPDFVQRYTKDLLSIHDNYLNCSKLDNYKIDNQYWVDVSHYNVKLGDLILSDIISGKNKICINLDKTNIRDYLKNESENVSNILYDLLEDDMKTVPHSKYFSKRKFTKKVNLKKIKKFTFKKKFLSENQLLILIDIQIFKPTKVTLQYNTNKALEYSSITELFKYDGWPKVSNIHTISLPITSEILSKNGFELIANKDINIKKISIFEKE